MQEVLTEIALKVCSRRSLVGNLSVLDHRARSLVYFILVVAVTTGCASYSSDVPSPEPISTVDHPSRIIAVLSSSQALAMDDGRIIRPELVERRTIKYRLSDTNLFFDVKDIVEASEKAVKFTFRVDSHIDRPEATNRLKGVCIGLSFGLLAPVMLMEVGYNETISVEAVRWDGATRQYRASGDGSAQYQVFSVGGEQRLIIEVHERLLNSIMNQIGADWAFYVCD